MRDIVIVGAGGHGRETLDVIESMNREKSVWRFLGFVDDDPAPTFVAEDLLLGPISAMRDIDASYVIAIGSPAVRAKVELVISTWRQPAARLVHASATIGHVVQIGDGVIVAAGARVTTNVSLGHHVHVNVNAVVSHDCIVGSHTSVSPGAHLNGAVVVGERVLIGAGAIVLPQVRIGDGATVGAGAVVTEDVADGRTVVGLPAK